MIQLLTEEEQKYVTKKTLSDIEAQIIIKFGFDFNFPGPMQFVERYLRIMNADRIPAINNIVFAILKLQLIDPRFLSIKPS